MKKVIFSFVLTALSVVILISMPFFNLALPGVNDPFLYLHHDFFAPLFKPWVGSQSKATLRRYGNVIPAVEAMAAYTAVSNALQNKTFVINTQLSIHNGDGGSGCEAIRFARDQMPVMVIPAQALQGAQNGSCQYGIDGAKLSDDGKLLAVQMMHWVNEDDRFIALFDVAGSAVNLLATMKGSFTKPAAFAQDGGLRYASNNLLGNNLGFCAIKKWLNGIDTCELWKYDLPKSAATKAMSLYRDKHNEATWMILSERVTGPGRVYQWTKTPHGNHLEPTPIEGINRLVENKGGFIYAQEAPAAALTPTGFGQGAPNDDGLLQFLAYTHHQPAKLIATVPGKRSKWTRNQSGALVWIDGGQNEVNQLLRLSEHGISRLALNEQLQHASHVSLLSSDQPDHARIRITEQSGQLRDGKVNTRGDFVEEDAIKYRFPMRTTNYLARSADGVRVPCTLVKKAGSVGPQAAIVVVYGAYGTILRPSIGALEAAVISSNITYLFAHVRGGGELGQAWAKGGQGINKMKATQDTEACIASAIADREVISGKILMHATSAGGVPAMMVALNNPDKVKGAWLNVPFLDSAGTHHNDVGDDTEFGRVNDANESAARLKNSPYQRLLTADQNSGAFLLTCGGQDTRTPPWHCMKAQMAIRHYHPNRRSYLRVAEDAAHFAYKPGSQEEKEFDFLALAFIFDTLH